MSALVVVIVAAAAVVVVGGGGGGGGSSGGGGGRGGDICDDVDLSFVSPVGTTIVLVFSIDGTKINS